MLTSPVLTAGAKQSEHCDRKKTVVNSAVSEKIRNISVYIKRQKKTDWQGEWKERRLSRKLYKTAESCGCKLCVWACRARASVSMRVCTSLHPAHACARVCMPGYSGLKRGEKSMSIQKWNLIRRVCLSTTCAGVVSENPVPLTWLFCYSFIISDNVNDSSQLKRLPKVLGCRSMM